MEQGLCHMGERTKERAWTALPGVAVRALKGVVVLAVVYT